MIYPTPFFYSAVRGVGGGDALRRLVSSRLPTLSHRVGIFNPLLSFSSFLFSSFSSDSFPWSNIDAIVQHVFIPCFPSHSFSYFICYCKSVRRLLVNAHCRLHFKKSNNNQGKRQARISGRRPKFRSTSKTNFFVFCFVILHSPQQPQQKTRSWRSLKVTFYSLLSEALLAFWRS